MEQIIKFGISNYLQLCVEAGFSQIQSHIYLLSQFFQHSRSSLAHYKNRNAIMKHATKIVTIGDDIDNRGREAPSIIYGDDINLTRILTRQDHVSSQILDVIKIYAR